MSDEADRSDDRIAMAIADGIAKVRRAPTLTSNGVCYFCAEAVAADARFCSTECRADFEVEQQSKRRAGKA